MAVSLKDVLKLLGIMIVSFCAIFVGTFMLNFYLDAKMLESSITSEFQTLYDAQLSTAKFTSAISMGCLSVIAIIMVAFYIKLYIDNHSKQLGILKAIGYSNTKLASHFWIFGLSVGVGVLLGFIAGYISMPLIYEKLQIQGAPIVEIHFHLELLILLVILPTILFSLISILYAKISLNKPVLSMIKGQKKMKIKNNKKENLERSFLNSMSIETIKTKKSLAFFFAFACFCFAAMIQMSFTMKNLTTGETMSEIILVIGLILALTTSIMAVSSLISENKKSVALMKTFGYSTYKCSFSIFKGYVIFALLGFGIGTLYQFGLLKLMVDVFFKDVEGVFAYKFDVPIFFYTLLAFVVLYVVLFGVFNLRLKNVSLKEIMSED